MNTDTETHKKKQYVGRNTNSRANTKYNQEYIHKSEVKRYKLQREKIDSQIFPISHSFSIGILKKRLLTWVNHTTHDQTINIAAFGYQGPKEAQRHAKSQVNALC